MFLRIETRHPNGGRAELQKMRVMLMTASTLCLLAVVLSSVEAGKKGGGGYKKGGKGLSTLKKAAVIGVTAYGGYQLGKLTARYASHGSGWGFNDWNTLRQVDGFMCRSDTDCKWIDRSLFCQDYELDFQPNELWFGGDMEQIVGQCSCPSGMVWDDREMQCQQLFFSEDSPVSILVMVVIAIVALVFLCCCLGAAVFIFRRFCR